MRIPIGDTALKWIKRAGLAVLLAAIALLVVREAREMDWPAVLSAVREFSWPQIAAAFALGIPSYLAVASYDLFGRQATGHRLPLPRVALISYTGYCFSLNLGALVGGLAFRYRLYSPYGLSAMTIGQIVGLTVITNWSGYVLMAGAVLVYAPPELPAEWGVAGGVMRATGVALLAAAAAYLAACVVKGGERVVLKGRELRLPTIGTAALQVLASTASWASIGAVVAWLLRDADVSWFAVMPVLMVSAIAGVWSHVPSALGVTELVFLALLGHLASRSEILAAILIFRVVYYLVPLGIAIGCYAYLELTAKRVRGGTRLEPGARS